MTIFTSPPTVTKYSFKKGDTHIGVWAIQRLLNTVYSIGIPETGFFGDITEGWVRRYQQDTSAFVDGVVGPETQARIVRSCVVRAPHGTSIPKGLLEGIIQAESGRYLAAVNSKISGGVDCGLTQRRVYGPPYDPELVKAAFDPIGNVSRSAGDLWDRYQVFAARVGRGEYAWRLAALAHNWPEGADVLSRGRQLSTTNHAWWAPPGTVFADGMPVISQSDWAKFYAMGSHFHQHRGLVTQLAYGVPTSG